MRHDDPDEHGRDPQGGEERDRRRQEGEEGRERQEWRRCQSDRIE